MKTNKYYHSKVKLKEYEFPKIYLDNYEKNEIETFIKLSNKFSKSNDKYEKYQLALQLPKELFATCRYCGKLIVNSNFRIVYNKKNNYIMISLPTYYCREINDKKYYLSCCEDCLLEHFKDDPPKSPKYYFMKANKYGAYSYNIDYDDYKKICSMVVGVTQKSMIRKWGELEGQKHWENYCKKQSETNTFQYKKEKYNWTQEDFNNFNKSRAVTLKNLQAKYGNELGKKYFDDYVSKQKLTKSQEYMINKFGEEKTKEINRSKALTLENYIKRLGEEEGLKQYELTLNKHHNYYSKISQNFFNELDQYLSKKYTTYYANKNNEYGVHLMNSYVRLDYFILELNLCIEFNGTYYHGDPRIFKEDDHPNPHNKVITAKEIWEHDKNRYKMLKECRDIDTIIVWENDYINGIDIEDFIKNTLKIVL